MNTTNFLLGLIGGLLAGHGFALVRRSRRHGWVFLGLGVTIVVLTQIG